MTELTSPGAASGVLGRLKYALTGNTATPLVLVGNFEVEDHWATGEYGLPTVAMSGGRAVVNRLDEFTLLLAGSGDHVVLKAAPDADHLAWLTGLGLGLPSVLMVSAQDPQHTVSEDLLADPALLTALTGPTFRGAWLLPHGVSALEETIARRTGLPLAAPPAAVCKQVNSKIYSRLIAAELGIRQPSGAVCRDLEETAEAFALARSRLAAGGTVVVKDAYGVSGKGILVVRDPERLDRTERMLRRRADRTGETSVALVVEEWLDKRCDLNYQFTVARSGTVSFDFVKEAITESGVHRGHRMPARIAPAAHEQIRCTAALLGERLYADSYFGVVGVDALVTSDGELQPLIEINARSNMSTYQERALEALAGPEPGTGVLATQYLLKLNRPVSFAWLHDTLGDLLLTPGATTGLLITNFATVNAAASDASRPGRGFDGRLHGIVLAQTAEQADALDRAIRARLTGPTALGGALRDTSTSTL